MKGKILGLAAVLLVFGVQTQVKGSPKKAPETPAQEIAKAEAQCAEPHTPSCQAYQLLTKVQNQVVLHKAMVSLDAMSVEYSHKPRATVTKSAKEAVDAVSGESPIIDHVLSLQLPTNVMSGIRSYWSQALACTRKLEMGKSEALDDFTARVDACEVPVQFQLDEVFVALGYPAQKQHLGFRKSAWGDSPEKVVAVEGKPSDKTPDGSLFVYQTTLSGHDAFAFFRFVQGKLVSGGYTFTDRHSNDNMFIDDYDAIADALKTKYGPPSSHDTNWETELFKNDRSHWGTAIASGQMNMLEMWSLGDTDIMHALDGDNFKVKHLIRYTSIEYKPLINQAQKAKSTEGL
ncbi:hypothetical protein B5P43_10385 [Bacillus sp. SRB_336]|nr:hypothetical protein B5P43_10385 [Bacillus sp. SRB_336]